MFVLKGLVDPLQSGKVDKVTGKGLSTLDVKHAMIEINSIPMGCPYPVWFENEIFSVVNKYPDYFVILSADQMSSGQYNFGKLTSQAEHDSEETRFYTAIISDALSPLNGKNITLINSVKNLTGVSSNQPAFLGAGETSQTRLVNRIQGHWIGNAFGTISRVDAANLAPLFLYFFGSYFISGLYSLHFKSKTAFLHCRISSPTFHACRFLLSPRVF